MIVSIFAALFSSAQTVISRYVLNKRKIDYKIYTIVDLFLIFILMLIISPFYFSINITTFPERYSAVSVKQLCLIYDKNVKM